MSVIVWILCVVFLGIGDHIPSWNGDTTVQPDRPHTARHGGNVPG